MQLTSTVGCIKSSTHFYTVFYAQSVVHRLQSVFYTDHVNKSTQSMPVPWVCVRQLAFITKARTIILFMNMTLNCY